MSSINTQELSNFENMAEHWWDKNGPLKPLHKLNPTRISHIEQQIKSHFQCDELSDLTVLDIGCGGGLVCEALAKKNAKVTGIDAGQTAINIAKKHCETNGLDITYKCETSNDHHNQYDIVLALEIIEHVENPDEFVKSVLSHVKPNGLCIFSTLNRTPKSFALGIVAAEYILRWLPRGTHDWKKFLKPSELAKKIENNAFQICDISGLIYNPFLDHFSISKTDIDVNYFISATHKK